MLPSNMGGSGNDLLIDVEMVQFKESSIDLGLRIELNNWDNDVTNGYDWVEVKGTDGADDITNWGTGSYLDTALDDDCVFASSTIANNATSISLVGGGSISFNQAHQIAITSAQDDTGREFTITGTDSNGNQQTEKVTGANGTSNNKIVTSTKSFLTVTKISASGNDSTGNIKIGVASATSTTSQDVAGDNEIRGKGGDDVIFGYAGGDRISGDGGNDLMVVPMVRLSLDGFLKTQHFILVRLRIIQSIHTPMVMLHLQMPWRIQVWPLLSIIKQK